MTKISRQRSRRTTRLRTGVSAIALVIGAGLLLAPVSASAGGPFQDLCDTTITTKVTLKDVDDTVNTDCSIDIATRGSLTVKDSSSITVNGYLDIDGDGRAAFTSMNSTWDISDRFGFAFDKGSIVFIDHNYVSVGANFSIRSNDGDIVFKDNPNMVKVDSRLIIRPDSVGDTADIIVENTYFDLSSRVSFETEDGDIEILNGTVFNMTDTVDSITLAAEGKGDLTFRDSMIEYASSGGNENIDSTVTISTNLGDLTFRDNVVLIYDSGDGDSGDGLTLNSVGGGDVVVRDNIESHVSDSVNVDSNAGNLTVRGNRFVGSSGNDADSTGKCTVTDNIPGFTGINNCPTGPG